MRSIPKVSLACTLIAAGLIAGCGSSSSPTTSSAPSGSTSAAAGGSSTPSTTATASPGAGALSADARSAATGDIPDSQVFLVLTDKAGGFSMKYPEGWTQSGSSRDVTISAKNNLVHVVIATGPAPTPASVAAQLNALKASNPTLTFASPQTVTISSSPVVKAVYTTESAPNPVTGKRVKLIVDRYELAKGGKVATVDLGTPVGVDNVDAYRKMIESFRWQ
jgi:hypothetical protein